MYLHAFIGDCLKFLRVLTIRHCSLHQGKCMCMAYVLGICYNLFELGSLPLPPSSPHLLTNVGT